MSVDETNRNARHAARMQRKKAVVNEKIAQATQDKGLILILTGNGKGKSSSGFGMAARALGHGMRVGIVQFIKGGLSRLDPATGEEAFFRRFPEVEYHVMGEGFTWETQDRERDIQAARTAWEKALVLLRNPAIHLVLLDELNIVLKYGYLSLDEVISALNDKPPMQHVIVTGRSVKPELVAIADTVSEVMDVKHAFRAGIRAQRASNSNDTPLSRAAGVRARLRPGQDHGHGGARALSPRAGTTRARVQDRAGFSRSHDPRTGIRESGLSARSLDGGRSSVQATAVRRRGRSRSDLD